MNRTRKNHRGIATKGWKNQTPGYHQKTIMLKKCGNKCFLEPNKSFPICKKNTCKISSKGVYAAYIRARQFKKRNISKKAKRMLIRMHSFRNKS
jgi:hypothetical protein